MWMAANGRAPSSINLRLSAIAHAHHRRGVTSPTNSKAVRDTKTEIMRALNSRPRNAKSEFTPQQVRAILAGLPDHTLRGRRDRALISLACGIGLHRSEVARLEMADLGRVGDEPCIRIRRDGTDRPSTTVPLAIGGDDYLRAWCTAANLVQGAIFRRIRRGDHLTSERLSCQAVALIIKKGAALIDLNPANYSGESPRKSFIGWGLAAGYDLETIREYSRLSSLAALSRYVRRKGGHPGDRFL